MPLLALESSKAEVHECVPAEFWPGSFTSLTSPSWVTRPYLVTCTSDVPCDSATTLVPWGRSTLPYSMRCTDL